jgi:hypothetical protein
MGEAAHKTGSRYVAFGTRSLAVATGAEHSSVAAVLRQLAADSQGWIDLVEPGHGERGDLYALTIPNDLAPMAADLRWDRGRAHALRPAFRELGHVAAFVFEAVEAGRADSITTLVPATGLARSSVHAAVDILTSHGLLERVDGHLHAHPGRLNQVAELVGALEEVTAQLRSYARERAEWHAYLRRHDDHEALPRHAAAEDLAWLWSVLDDDDVGDATLIELVSGAA